MKTAAAITVLGIVQGVGYRPFVARLAIALGLEGTVMNSGGIVRIVAQGNAEAMDKFVHRLRRQQPPGADVSRIIRRPAPWRRELAGFAIIDSEAESGGGREAAELPLLPPDLPVCADCLRELKDPEDRRYGYSFISCVSCGPRYTIMEELPYDREQTVMDDFAMCPRCREEYDGVRQQAEGGGEADPAAGGDLRQEPNRPRRHHAQTISCHECGPQLLLRHRGGVSGSGRGSRGQAAAATPAAGALAGAAALREAIRLLRQGEVIAVKGIGGYHFACSPSLPGAVEKLRRLKRRDSKPFAVMFPDMAAIKTYCLVSAQEEELLSSSPRPIVLLNKRQPPDTLAQAEAAGQSPSEGQPVEFRQAVSGASRFLAAFLPYTPLHAQLTEACGPLVMTSGNFSGEPIITEDRVMLELPAPELAAVLYSLRRIVAPLDDSVARVAAGKVQLIRRSRGYAPLPLFLAAPGGLVAVEESQQVLAAGSDLKAGFCLLGQDREAGGGRAYLSQYFGDLEHFPVHQAYCRGLEHMRQLFRFSPRSVVCDLHPGYLSSALAEQLARREGLPLLRVQHHHAHAASVMAEHELDGCIAVVFDGTGYGVDGAVWGGEFLICRDDCFVRAGQLAYVALCGGDRVSRDAGLAALCYLIAAGADKQQAAAGLAAAPAAAGLLADYDAVEAALRHQINTRPSSSMGRLFDAVSAVLGFGAVNSYEGQCAIALENGAAAALKEGIKPYPLRFRFSLEEAEPDRPPLQIDQIAMLRDVFRAGVDPRAIALGFHLAVIELVVEVCQRLHRQSGERRVALSGGVFANLLLIEGCVEGLAAAGFQVYVNEAVPGNDSGICLGQAWLGSRQRQESRENRHRG